MAKKKKATEQGFLTVTITGSGCRYGDTRHLPGETATVPAEIAEEWIRSGRATYNVAEVEEHDNG